MVNSISTSSVNPLQMFNAMNAFGNSKMTKPAELQPIETSAGININDNSIFQNQNLEEIRNYAEAVGETNLSNDDIQYGLTYGRSVIADYLI